MSKPAQIQNTPPQPQPQDPALSSSSPGAKSPIKSKLNWVGAFLVAMGTVTDPEFRRLFGDLVPPDILNKIMFISGWLVLIFRTLGTSKPLSLDWRNPWK